MRISDTVTDGVLAPTYPVVEYPHLKGGGDADGSGFVYRCKAISSLRGNYIFGDISTGNLWYVDYTVMLAADDGDPRIMATMRSRTSAQSDAGM